MVFRFIFTSSINTPERESLYFDRIRKCLRIIQDLPFSVYIVENNGERHTKLNDIQGVNLTYTNINKINAFTCIGIKECWDINYLGEKYEFNDDDLIIKITGLYTLEEPNMFLEFVNQSADRYDAFIKWANITDDTKDRRYYDDCCMGLYVLRYKYLKNFNFMEMHNSASMEHVFAKHIRKEVPPDRIANIEHLGLIVEKWNMLV